MAVTCTGEGRVLRAAISGEVDHHRARAIMEELSRQIDLELPRSLTLDLEGVTFMDSSGIAVLLVSADLNEVMELSDSLIVMQGGHIAAYFEDTKELTDDQMGEYMLGLKQQSAEQIRRVCHD